MPSYYDSTEKQPGKAKVKYKKGGKVKKGKVKKVEPKKVAPKKVEPKKKAGRGEMLITGRKVKKMSKGGRTVARGSGAARTQYFGKNG